MMTEIKLSLIGLIFFYSFVFAQQDSTSFIVTDSLAVDSSAVNISDSLLTSEHRDTLRPVYYMEYIEDLTSQSSLPKSKIDKIDYRYLGNILMNLPFGYNAELGAIGSPEELFIYGLGFNNISYLQNGIELTNRYQNSLDLNLIQTENVDLIELPSLASGFIYNNRNNPLTINLIQYNKVSARPYSRIRFYQAPDNEGAFDGRFSAYLFSRVNISFDISNQSADSRYKNSELSSWQFGTNVRYMPSNSLNLIAGYKFSNINMDLNGGIDILTTPDLIYNSIEAAVNFPDRYHKSTTHNFSLSSILEIDSLSHTNLTFYYQYFIDEFRQNEFSTDSTETKFINDNSYKSFGVNLFQRFQLASLKLDLIGNFERTNFDVAFSSIDKINRWSFGGKLSWDFKSGLIIPSVFAKTSGKDESTYSGLGGEVKINPLDWLSLKASASTFTRSSNWFFDSMNKDIKVNVTEIGLNVKSSFSNAELSYFSITQNDYQLAQISGNTDFIYTSELINYSNQDYKRSGLNLKIDLKVWKFLLSSNSSLYFGEDEINQYEVPGITSYGGLYYVDTLFNSNLDLKAGINYKYFDQRGFSVYDFQRLQSAFSFDSNSPIIGYNSQKFIKSSYQFDLFVAGTIREKATVYLVFENFAASEYFIVPYYPVYPQGFRFGVAWEFLD